MHGHVDKGDFVGALFIDFRKAFDVVDHSILIKKLSMYKIEDQSLLWFISYLNLSLWLYEGIYIFTPLVGAF